jgi:hypothetical protein
MKNSGRYTEVSFDLTESGFKYLGGRINKMDSLLLLKDTLTIQFPIEILEIQRKKYRGIDKHYYRIKLSIHVSDMKGLETTLKNNPNEYHKADYSQLVSDCIHAYAESLEESGKGIVTPKEILDNRSDKKIVQEDYYLDQYGLRRFGLPGRYIWEPSVKVG